MFDPFEMFGVGLHTGVESRVLVAPGSPGTGTVFEVDGREIPAAPSYLSSDSRLGTSLVSDGRCVRTVEHLMAAVAAVAWKDIRIEMDGPEVPVLDGSAMPWYRALLEAGACPGFDFFDVQGPIFVGSGASSAALFPVEKGEQPCLRVSVDFERIDIRGEREFHPIEDGFETIASARTFALETDLESIFKDGFAKGGNLDNSVVFGEMGPLNPGGLRFEDEPIRHKLVDAVGDLGLLGALPRARIELNRPGHHLLHKLVREIVKSRKEEE